MKKVLVITPTLNPNSGWGRYSFEIVKRLEKSFDVQCLVEGSGTQDLSGKKDLFSFVRNILLVRKYSKTVDIVHAFEGWPYAVYAYFSVLGTDKKFFISGHGTYTVSPLGKFIKGFILRRAYLRANMIFCNSRYTSSQISKKVPKARVTVIHLGSSEISDSGKYDDAVEKMVSGKNPIILTVGALKERKGQIYTLQAISILKKSFPDILYVVVGDDSDQSYKNRFMEIVKKDGLEKNVLIRKMVSDDELSSWYKKADVFALNSVNHDGHFEGFGLVFLEGYHFGLPAVGSRGCGIEDAILDEETGYLTNQKDPKDISKAIKKALELSSNVEKIKIFAQSFSWQETTSRYLNHYNHQ